MKLHFAFVSGLLLSAFVSGYAQEVNPVEFEINAGLTFPLSNGEGVESPGPKAGLEFRYNLEELPVSAGFQIDISAATRHKAQDRNAINSLRTVSLAFTGDYNFRPGTRFSPFVGCAIGVATRSQVLNDFGTEDYWLPHYGWGFVAAPRIGAEVFSHVRLTLEARLGARMYNTVGLTLGYAFGGGVKK